MPQRLDFSELEAEGLASLLNKRGQVRQEIGRLAAILESLDGRLAALTSGRLPEGVELDEVRIEQGAVWAEVAHHGDEVVS